MALARAANCSASLADREGSLVEIFCLCIPVTDEIIP